MQLRLTDTLAVGFITLLVNSAFSATTEPTATDQLREAIKSIKQQEDFVQNMIVEAKWKGQRLDDETLKLVSAGDADIKAYFDGMPGGRVKAEIPRSLSPVVGADTPFYLEAFVLAYNGRIGEVYQSQTGDFTKPTKVSDGIIMGKEPREIASSRDQVGRYASIFGFAEAEEFDRHRLSWLLQEPGVDVIAKRVAEADGRILLQVTRTAENVKVNWGKYDLFLDPQKNYSIVKVIRYAAITISPGHYSVTNSTEIGGMFTVSDLWEPSPGVFYPKHLAYEGFAKVNGQRIPAVRCEIDVKSVKVNDPSVTDATFVFAFPKGTTVVEAATGKRFLIAGTPEEQTKIIESAVQQASQKAATSSPSTAKP